MKNSTKFFRYLGKALKFIIYGILILFIAVVLLQKFSNNSMSLFNYRLFTVMTGSMQPKYNIGDVLLCKEVDPETLKVGDDITYIGEIGSYKGKAVTHRIVKIEKSENNELLFHTRGLTNSVEDPVVKEDQVYGKIVRNMDGLSYIHKLISTPSGFYLCIFVPLMILIGSEIISSMVERFENKKAKK